MINAGYYLYPLLLCYCEIIPSVLLLHYAYNVPTLPMYFCENFGHHMVYFMKYLCTTPANPYFSHHDLDVVIFCLIAFFKDVK